MTSSLAPLKLLRHLRQVIASPIPVQDCLNIFVRLIAEYMTADVCSLYIARHDNILELYATQGLNPQAVHKTTLKVGEGIIGHTAKSKESLAISDAPSHEYFSYKPETGEDLYNSMAAVPLLRNNRAVGVLAVQNIMHRIYNEDELEILETVAMLLTQMLSGTTDFDAIATTSQSIDISGISIYEGMVSGNIFLHEPYVKVTKLLADDLEYEHERLQNAVEKLRSSVDNLVEGAVTGLISNDTRDIMETYRMFTRDKGWFRKMSAAVAQGLTAEAAVERIRAETRAHLSNLENHYMRDRYHDFEDLANRLLRLLSGKPLHNSNDLPEKSILIARSMGPADLLEYDLSRIRGLVIEEASQTAHVSILARSLSIPMIGRAEGVFDTARNYQPALLDADSGILRINPTAELLETFRNYKENRILLESERSEMRDCPAVSKDGIQVDLMMNAGLTYDLPHLEASGASGIGLLRTELQLLLSGGDITFDEQVRFYKQVFERAGDKPVYFRTLDVGGDKVPANMAHPYEENPALGFRAIRISSERPALLRLQIRAMIMASGKRPLNIMFPMIADIFEFDIARQATHTEMHRMQKLGYDIPETLRLGIMLEVPSAVFRIRQLKGICDFISVGSNDLLQFYFAADRDNPKTSSRYDRLSPASLSFLKFILDEANATGIPIRICGEMAGKPVEAMALIALGYRNFSMGAAQIPQIKLRLRHVDIENLRTHLLPELNSSNNTLRNFIKQIISY